MTNRPRNIAFCHPDLGLGGALCCPGAVTGSGALEDTRPASMLVRFCHELQRCAGAERLVVDAAVELARAGHSVRAFMAPRLQAQT